MVSSTKRLVAVAASDDPDGRLLVGTDVCLAGARGITYIDIVGGFVSCGCPVALYLSQLILGRVGARNLALASQRVKDEGRKDSWRSLHSLRM